MAKPTAILPLYRASGWSCANGKADERQPHLFYMAGDVDKFFDAQQKEVNALVDAHAFERRKWEALEAFYLKELGRG